MTHASLPEIRDGQILPTLQRIAYINATEHVREFVAQRAKGVILHDLSPESFGLYQKLEELQTKKIGLDIVNVYASAVRPALRSYMDARYPAELAEHLRSADSDMF
jgi:hypothetical protein